MHSMLWNQEEDDVIKRFYFEHDGKDKICKLLPQRKWHNINRRATKLGLRKYNYWTEGEEILLRRLYCNSTDDLLKSNFPDRSIDSIDLHANLMGLTKGYKNAQQSDLSILLEETPETYYWIGFILADGHISSKYRLSFALSPKDKSSVEALARFIKCPNVKEGTRCVSVKAQNQDILPLVCKKFNISHIKTYEPPRLEFIRNDKLLIALIIGYIDGDGNIRRNNKRNDFAIRLHAHKSWLDIYRLFENRLYTILDIRKNVSLTKIDKYGYVGTSFGNSILCKKLKLMAIDMKLPIMKRKWDNIDVDFISKQELALERKTKVIDLYSKGHTRSEICKLLDLKYVCVSQIIRTNK